MQANPVLNMRQIEILVGSMLGATEYVADAISAKLSALGIEHRQHLNPDLPSLNINSLWFVCTSTHGAGELPDNIQPFARQIAGHSLLGQPYLVVGLGDSSYDTFCEGSKQMQRLFDAAGAKLLAPPLYVDVLEHPVPEDKVIEWIESELTTDVLMQWLDQE